MLVVNDIAVASCNNEFLRHIDELPLSGLCQSLITAINPITGTENVNRLLAL